MWHIFPDEFDLVGVLLQAGSMEDITVPVHGKMTLGEAFREELTKRRLTTDALELVAPTGTCTATYDWESPAHLQKV